MEGGGIDGGRVLVVYVSSGFIRHALYDTTQHNPLRQHTQLASPLSHSLTPSPSD